MRIALIPLFVLSLLSVGCAGFIAGFGRDPKRIDTREKVHEIFGEPAITGTNEDESSQTFTTQTAKKGTWSEVTQGFDTSFEEYRTRRKIAVPNRSEAFKFYTVMTAGLMEAFLLPDELVRNIVRIASGQKVRFLYDKNGNVIDIFLNGVSVFEYYPVP